MPRYFFFLSVLRRTNNNKYGLLIKFCGSYFCDFGLGSSINIGSSQQQYRKRPWSWTSSRSQTWTRRTRGGGGGRTKKRTWSLVGSFWSHRCNKFVWCIWCFGHSHHAKSDVPAFDTIFGCSCHWYLVRRCLTASLSTCPSGGSTSTLWHSWWKFPQRIRLERVCRYVF